MRVFSRSMEATTNKIHRHCSQLLLHWHSQVSVYVCVHIQYVTPAAGVCVCVCPFFQCRVWPSHLTFPVLVLVGVLALTLPPQLLQVWLGLLQRFLLHLVLHLIPFECGLKQRKRCIKKVLVKINTFNFFGDFTLMGEFIIKKTNKNTVNLVRNKTNKYSI